MVRELEGKLSWTSLVKLARGRAVEEQSLWEEALSVWGVAIGGVHVDFRCKRHWLEWGVEDPGRRCCSGTPMVQIAIGNEIVGGCTVGHCMQCLR